MSLRVRLLALCTVLAVEGSVRADDKAACIAAAETGQDLRVEGKLGAARERFLECSSPACPPAVRVDCARFLEEVEKNLPSIVISAVDSKGADLVDAHAFLDDAPTPLDGKAVNVDPGKHVVRIDPKSGPALRTEIVVSEGEKNRKVQVLFPAKPAPPATPALEPARPSIAAYVIGGAGLALVGGSVYLGLAARRDISDLRSSCAPYCSAEDVRAPKRALLFADIGVGLGAVALGVATYMIVFPSRSGATSVVGAAHVPSGAIVQWSSVF